LFFTLVIFLKLFLENKKLIKTAIFVLLFYVISLLFLINVFVGFDLFFYSYITRNVQYAANFSSKPWGVAIIENIYYQIKFFLPFYMIIIFISVFIVIKYFRHLLLIFQFKNVNTYFTALMFSGLFIVSLVSVLIPKNNFFHYYLLMFPSIVFLVVHLLETIRMNTISLFVILGLVNVNVFQSISEESYEILIKGNSKPKLFYEQYKISKELSKEVKNVLSSEKKVINHSLVILGWFNALPLYNQYKTQFIFPYRSGHADFLVSSSYLANQKFFDFELKNLVSDITKNKSAILDVENVITKIKSPKFHKFLNQHFKVVKQTSLFTLLIPNK
jgi:hypothetical protein